ncbi:hypothetical protein GCM10009557_32340 [Virgisporangium ochraceum]|uniref:Uncharacterized protein n=1 Tax=Virgisporangium ochraceum TaxID=65505 RepID=A0A8J3ZW59_9ACTN|nr:hypothetical protein [Virgisporangium ochraceum]GIJ70741.1 hypothetical protein Voc01_056580 [Virgisporangium ochraceum]
MPRVLIAPVTVTPTKPLTPSHIKGLLWVDVMYRATAALADTTYRYSNTTYNVTAQTLGYWEFLDRTIGDTDYSAQTEEELGESYMRFQAEGRRPPFAALRPYLRAVESSGWVHPASARLLELWTGHFARLGLHDPGLTTVRHPAFGLEELIDHLAARDLCLDCRPDNGPVYLDLTRYGMPLRQIVTRECQPNYLAGALRELVPLATSYDRTVLVHDRELTDDYLLLQRLLGVLGAEVVRDAVTRVPVDGVIRSSRFGGWHGYTVPSLVETCGDADPEVLRLGMRLYFIAVLGRGSDRSFQAALLRQYVDRARTILAGGAGAATHDVVGYLRRHRPRGGLHVDPYRLTSAMLGRRDRAVAGDVAGQVYC